MKLLHLTFIAVVATFALAVTACGGGDDVPADAVAVVDGTEITKEELDRYLQSAKKYYAEQKQDFPRVGTPEYQDFQRQTIAGLVQRVQFEHEAEDLGIEVSDKEVNAESGRQKELEEQLKERGFTDEMVRDFFRNSLVARKIYDEITKDVKVPDGDVVAYYQQNLQQYQKPESRDVRHILIAEKGANDQVDYAKSKTEADRIYGLLQNGGDFGALAQQYSEDPGSKGSGGKLTINRGQTVPEFDKFAFDAKQGELSKPIKTTYGYHIIEALSPVRKATGTPLDKVRASIKASLLQQKKQTFAQQWAEDVYDEYQGKTRYALGYEPPALPDASEPTETDTTETPSG
jgi:parvulin-like peptidyl-prolyl isomerase